MRKRDPGCFHVFRTGHNGDSTYKQYGTFSCPGAQKLRLQKFLHSINGDNLRFVFPQATVIRECARIVRDPLMRSKFGRRLIACACIDTTGVYDKVRISNVSLGIRATLSFDTFQSGTLSRVLDRSKVPAFKHFRRMLSLFLNQVYSTDADSALNPKFAFRDTVNQKIASFLLSNSRKF